MWLLNTFTLELCSFADGKVPYYIILSHTWGSEEVSFQDIQSPDARVVNKAGYGKVKKCCAEAAANGFQYVWIDTCCIDKTNNTELSEAINSMFRWYRDAAECYAYLEDVKPCEEAHGFANSKWFTRGWTLQELIAPSNVLFFDHYWNEIGSRASLGRIIEGLTRIPITVLLGESLKEYSVAQIMSWAAGRETTKIEDRAYALLGIFGVFMPMIYGEGEMAFRRLQLEVMKTRTDHSLFVWSGEGFERGPLARSPDEFARCGNIRRRKDNQDIAFEMTNLGLRITLPLSEKLWALGGHHQFAYLSCDENIVDSGCKEFPIGIWLSELLKDRKPTGQYVRTRPTEIYINHAHAKQIAKSTPLYIVERDIHNLNGSDMRERQFKLSPCLLFDYESLHKEGYNLEEKNIWSEGQYSIWLFETFRIRAELGHTWPWVLFFRHKERAERFWVALSMVNNRLWTAIETNVSDSETPNSILKHKPALLAHRKNDRWGVFDRVSKRLPSGRILKLVVKKGIFSSQLGFLANISERVEDNATGRYVSWPVYNLQGRDYIQVTLYPDSITQGSHSSDSNGYHLDLENLLLAGNNSVDIVGLSTSGNTTDNQEQGIHSATISNIWSTLPPALVLRPNIALLHASPNDMNLDRNVSSALAQLNSLISQIFTGGPDAAVLVAKIIGSPNAISNVRIGPYNEALGWTAENRMWSGEHVLVVGMQNALGPNRYNDCAASE